ncbi:hypothetical protein KQX54_019754 [Cotesia glomerata]|uniref:Uncharacterized protein n=1 Tax=Cotesia glomerata TaxID=32391 RepID=A0AAV7J0X3_COTGL|nr:hypothetical protein KQX54_019754 [Cotesia glomerata]
MYNARGIYGLEICITQLARILKAIAQSCVITDRCVGGEKANGFDKFSPGELTEDFRVPPMGIKKNPSSNPFCPGL